MRKTDMPRLIEDLSPPPAQIAPVLAQTRGLRRLSNFIGLSLLSQQLAAVAGLFAAAAVYYEVNRLFLGKQPDFWNLITTNSFLTDSNSVFSNLLSVFYYFSYMFVPFLLLVFALREHPFKIVPVKKKLQNRNLLFPALCVVFAFYILADFVAQYIQSFLGLFNLSSTSPAFTAPTNAPAYILYFFELCILAPICEEFIFRGVILQSLRKYGIGFSIVISALLFSMVHGNLVQMPLAFLIGLVFGVFVVEFGSIWVTVFMHFAVNSTSLLIDAVGNSWGSNAEGIFYVVFVGVVLFLLLISVVYLARHANLREKVREYRRCTLPSPFMYKRFFLAIATFFFTMLTLVNILLTIRWA